MYQNGTYGLEEVVEGVMIEDVFSSDLSNFTKNLSFTYPGKCYPLELSKTLGSEFASLVVSLNSNHTFYVFVHDLLDLHYLFIISNCVTYTYNSTTNL